MNFYFNVADLIDPNDKEGRSYRQINNSMIHKYKVDQLVECSNGVRLFVAKQTRDCDGTPLYCLTPKDNDFKQQREGFANSNWVNGISEDSLTHVE